MGTEFWIAVALFGFIGCGSIIYSSIYMATHSYGEIREKFVRRKYYLFGPWMINRNYFDEYCFYYKEFLMKSKPRRRPEIVKSLGFLAEKRRNKPLDLLSLQSEWLPVIQVMAGHCMPQEFIKAVYIGLFCLVKIGSPDQQKLKSNIVEIMRWQEELPADYEIDWQAYGTPVLWGIYQDHLHYYEQADSIEIA